MLFRCQVCHYIHEGTAPPAACPICGVGPELFEPYQEDAGAPHGDPWGAPAGPAADTGAASPSPHPSGPRIVVVGSGVAGCAAAEHARRTDPGASVALVHAEDGLPYRRIDLTRFLAGQVAERTLPLRDKAWFFTLGIERVHGRVRRIEPENGLLHLEGGGQLPFDRLVLATGAHAVVPTVPGTARQGVGVLRTLAQARQLMAETWPERPVVVVGGGLLGLETAVALASRGARVTVLEERGWLLSRQLPEVGAELLAGALRARGVSLLCGVQLAGIEGDEEAHAVRLADGRALPAELVVVSAGVRPNAGLASRAGLRVERGVVVDDAMRSSHPAIFAAGDVAEHRGQVAGLWPVAEEQGRVAGVAAAGGEVRYEALPAAVALKVLDLPVASAGEVHAEGPEVERIEERVEGSYLRLVARGGHLAGACLVGDHALLGPLMAALRERRPVSSLTEFLAGLRAPGRA